MSQLSLRNVNKIYPNGFQAVYDFNLEVEDKDFVVLVGPSGCGKSTTLRMIAGLEEITSGEIEIAGAVVNELDPKNRNISMVFQSYALYPHMTVFDNLSYGLKIKRAPINEIEYKVAKVARSLGLIDLLDRKPAELSGGQRQRVALGRAMVKESAVFLMDEPLSNLDAKLRVQTRAELIELHQTLGTTTIYVTHDQIEAMTMATKIVVMSDGYVEQVGTPEVMYNYPKNTFVGGFIGTPPMNFFETMVDKKGFFIVNGTKIKVSPHKLTIIKENDLFNVPIILGIRPEDIHVVLDDNQVEPEKSLNTNVRFAEILGADTNIYLEFDGKEAIAKIDETIHFDVGQEIKLVLDTDKIHFFSLENGERFSSKEEDEAREKLASLGRK